MIRFKRGQTFNFTGQLTNNAQPYPLDGCMLAADIRQQVNFEFVQHLTCTITDPVKGVITISAPSTDTEKWLAMPHLMDVRLVNAAGQTLISNTVEIEVLDTVTEAATP